MSKEIRILINKIEIYKKQLNESFINVDVPQDISDFVQNIATFNLNGVEYEILQFDGNKFAVELNGDEIGRATLNRSDPNFDGYYLDNIRIDPKHRRLGLATKMYEYIESIIGEKLKPSPIKQSPEIKKYWGKKNS